MASIKLSFNQEVRRAFIHGELMNSFTFHNLQQTAVQMFPQLAGASFCFQYVDDEGDKVSLSSDIELQEALRVMSSSMGVTALKFEIKVKSEQGNEQKSQEVHTHVACDECGMKPIVGIRYKCLVRDDFDLCEDCQAKKVQPYPMAKIYTPEQGKFLRHHLGGGHRHHPRHHPWFGHGADHPMMHPPCSGGRGGGRGGCWGGRGGHPHPHGKPGLFGESSHPPAPGCGAPNAAPGERGFFRPWFHPYGPPPPPCANGSAPAGNAAHPPFAAMVAPLATMFMDIVDQFHPDSSDSEAEESNTKATNSANPTPATAAPVTAPAAIATPAPAVDASSSTPPTAVDEDFLLEEAVRDSLMELDIAVATAASVETRPASIPTTTNGATNPPTGAVNSLPVAPHRLWYNELETLAQLGFTDAEVIIPLLDTHIAYPDPSHPANLANPHGYNDGMQRVVNHLLSL